MQKKAKTVKECIKKKVSVTLMTYENQYYINSTLNCLGIRTNALIFWVQNIQCCNTLLVSAQEYQLKQTAAHIISSSSSVE